MNQRQQHYDNHKHSQDPHKPSRKITADVTNPLSHRPQTVTGHRPALYTHVTVPTPAAITPVASVEGGADRPILAATPSSHDSAPARPAFRRRLHVRGESGRLYGVPARAFVPLRRPAEGYLAGDMANDRRPVNGRRPVETAWSGAAR